MWGRDHSQINWVVKAVDHFQIGTMLVILSPAKTLDYTPQRLVTKKSTPGFLNDSEELVGVVLFSEDATYSKLASLVAQGAEMRTTNISEEFTFEDYLEKYGNKAIPMFLLDSRKRLSILSGLPSADQVPAGSRIVALVKAERVVEKIEEKKQDAAKAQ